MKRLDLDDLPPKTALLLQGLEPGEELLLVQHGAVVGRLTAAGAQARPVEPEVSPEQHAREVFEHFRSSVEDEF
jgi:antitoxin (DNA-binding transcriptional repressor) of toxin-antitoxin stability system